MIENIIQELYDCEISCVVASEWDQGFTWKLGDDYNVFIAEGSASTFEEACEQLAAAAVKHFPESDFAQERAAEGSEIEAQPRSGAIRRDD